MSLMVKSVLATIFLGLGLGAVLSMFTLMGRAERSVSGTVLRRLHKTFGFIFFALLLVMSYLCLRYVKMAGANLSVRAVFHGVLALALFIVLAIKVSIVQFYKEFMRFVPTLGISEFALVFLVWATSAGHYFVTARRSPATGPREDSTRLELSAEAERGRELYGSNCSYCHYADSDQTRIGPGLKAVLKRDKLPSSGKPATPQNVRGQLTQPVGDMPSFEWTLSDEQIEDLLAYLKTL